MPLQPLARWKIGAALVTPSSKAASMPALTSICADATELCSRSAAGRRPPGQQPWQMPLPPSRLRSSARSRSFCWRVVLGETALEDGPMLPVVPTVPSPGCGRPSSEPVRARGIVLPAPTSAVEGETEPEGAAVELGAGPAPGLAAPVAADPPDVPAAPPAAPPDEPPPEDWASAAPPKASEAASARGMMVRDMGPSLKGGNAEAGAGFRSQHHVDQRRPAACKPGLERKVQLGDRRRPEALDPHGARERHPIDVRPVEAQHVDRLRADVLRPDVRELAPEDGVGAVVHDQGSDVVYLTRLRPQRLHIVNGAAVTLQAEHRAILAGNGGAGRHRQAVADRTAGELEPVVRRRAPER